MSDMIAMKPEDGLLAPHRATTREDRQIALLNEAVERWRIRAQTAEAALAQRAEVGTISVPKALLDRLATWNGKFPKGHIYNATDHRADEAELDAIIGELVRLSGPSERSK